VNDINVVYSERNQLAIALVKMAIELGLKAGRGIDNDHLDWEEKWRHVIYIQFPNGLQVSWHMSPNEINLLDMLPEFDGKWDGTFIGREPEWIKKVLSKSKRKGLIKHAD
jgi:hypothetical protein